MVGLIAVHIYLLYAYKSLLSNGRVHLRRPLI